MKKLLIIGVVLALGGCANKSIPIQNAATLNTLDGVASLYGTALSAARAYKALPLCKTGTKATIAVPCAQRSIIVRMQAADATAVSALTRANTFVQTYPNVDASNVISAASTAVSSLQAVIASTGVQ